MLYVFSLRHVLANLARFHAATHVFITEECGGTNYLKFRQDWELVCCEAFISDNNPMIESMFDTGVSSCMNILKVNFTPMNFTCIYYVF